MRGLVTVLALGMLLLTCVDVAIAVGSVEYNCGMAELMPPESAGKYWYTALCLIEIALAQEGYWS
jgi:hypothetical protein